MDTKRILIDSNHLSESVKEGEREEREGGRGGGKGGGGGGGGGEREREKKGREGEEEERGERERECEVVWNIHEHFISLILQYSLRLSRKIPQVVGHEQRLRIQTTEKHVITGTHVNITSVLIIRG